MKNMLAHIEAHTLTFVRIAFGLLWLQGASWKELPRFGLDAHENLYYWVSRAVEYPVWDVYTALIERVVLPNFLVFAWAIFLAELAIGLSFVLGVKTRWFALAALFMTANIALTVLNTPAEWPWSYALMAMVALVLFAYPGGRTRWSLEYWLKLWTRKA